MLNISPFTYGLIVQQVYDSGTVFEPKILDIKPEALRERFMEVIICKLSSPPFYLVMKKVVRPRNHLQTQKWENPLEAGDCDIYCLVGSLTILLSISKSWKSWQELTEFSSIQGVRNVASLSLRIGYPTLASAPHSVINGFKNLLAVAAATDIEFKEAKTVKEYLKDPSKFAAAAAPVAAPAAAAAAAPAKEQKKEESEEEEDDDMGFGLFD